MSSYYECSANPEVGGTNCTNHRGINISCITYDTKWSCESCGAPEPTNIPLEQIGMPCGGSYGYQGEFWGNQGEGGCTWNNPVSIDIIFDYYDNNPETTCVYDCEGNCREANQVFNLKIDDLTCDGWTSCCNNVPDIFYDTNQSYCDYELDEDNYDFWVN